MLKLPWSFTAFMFMGLIVVASDNITIYSVNRLETQSFNPPSDIISASIAAHSVITVNDGGVTQYAVKEVQSLKVYVQENITTITLLSTPTTVAYTIEQGHSVYNVHLAETVSDPAATGIFIDVDDINCTAADPSGIVVNCVERLAITNADGSLKTAVTTNFKGQITPLFTIAGTPTAKPSNSGNSGKHLASAVVFGYMAVSVIWAVHL